MTPDQSIDNRLPYIIGFVGGQGYGKTHLARMLARVMGGEIVSNDKIRRQLEAQGRNSGDQNIIHNTAYHQIATILRQGKNVIYDANALRQWKSIEALHCRYYFINLTCAEEVILTRLRNREQQVRGGDLSEDSLATTADYFAYKEEIKTRHFPPEKIFFEIATDQDLTPQIDALLAKINSE